MAGRDRATVFSTDVLGRAGSWQRIHLVDAAVFPAVPAMTYGLTVMANAHRIASESLALLLCPRLRCQRIPRSPP